MTGSLAPHRLRQGPTIFPCVRLCWRGLEVTDALRRSAAGRSDYYPAVSVYRGITVTVNFGPTFKHPPRDVSFRAVSGPGGFPAPSTTQWELWGGGALGPSYLTPRLCGAGAGPQVGID